MTIIYFKKVVKQCDGKIFFLNWNEYIVLRVIKIHVTKSNLVSIYPVKFGWLVCVHLPVFASYFSFSWPDWPASASLLFDEWTKFDQ